MIREITRTEKEKIINAVVMASREAAREMGFELGERMAGVMAAAGLMAILAYHELMHK